ncbi:MAG TPA: hypothetical protein VFV38_15455 [Ktedonobacteraceae bacterium]|jgi:hypothetical protein|nr:hypothetical protein [Ktedonobacteraceae bacterium]
MDRESICKEVQPELKHVVIPSRSRIRVTHYGPFRGMKGTIQAVDTIDDDLEEPFCFYLVALEGTTLQEPIWFEYDEIELIDSPLTTPQPRTEFAGIE